MFFFAFHRQIISAAHCATKASSHYYEVHAGLLRRFSYAPEVQISKVIAVIVNNRFTLRGMNLFLFFPLSRNILIIFCFQ